MKLSYATLVLLLCVSVGFGQQAKKLSLNQSVEIALDRNVAVIQARNNVQAAQSSTQAAVGGYLPTIEASGSFINQQAWSPETGGTIIVGGYPVYTTAGGFSMRQQFNAGFDGRITLFNGFATSSGVSRAEHTERATEQTLSRTEQQTIN